MNAAEMGFLGGILIGLSATLLLLFNGRIAGISGILNGLIQNSRSSDSWWRISFLFGLMGAGALMMHLLGRETTSAASWPMLVIGGVLVGFGTRMGNGCTSGHGVCGLGRLSKRSFLAVIMFMLTAFITVFITRHIFGAGS